MKNNSKQQHRDSNGNLLVILDDSPEVSRQVWSGLYLGLKVSPVAFVLFGFLGWSL